MIVPLRVSPASRGILATMTSAGVDWYLPPKGAKIVAAPMELSNLSTRPFCEQWFRSDSTAVQAVRRSAVFSWAAAGRFLKKSSAATGQAISTAVWRPAPLLSRKPRSRSTMARPRHFICRRGRRLTRAITVASMFSAAANCRKRRCLRGRHHHGHALLGLGDGEFGAVEAVVFLGHVVEVDLERGRDLADGDRDAAGAEVVADLDLPAGARVAEQALDLPFGGRVAFLHFGGVQQRDSLCSLEEPVAPPMPSRPVRPPISRMTSPGAGVPRRTFARGAAAITAPISRRLAT